MIEPQQAALKLSIGGRLSSVEFIIRIQTKAYFFPGKYLHSRKRSSLPLLGQQRWLKIILALPSWVRPAERSMSDPKTSVLGFAESHRRALH